MKDAPLWVWLLVAAGTIAFFAIVYFLQRRRGAAVVPAVAEPPVVSPSVDL